MSFESGRMSFRMFYLPQPMPRDAVARFAAHAAPPLDALSGGEIHGWVSGRHLLDRQIDETTAFFGGYLRLTLMKAERKIPESLLRAECRMEELARLQATGQPALERKERVAIRRDITARLLPSMPPQLKGMSLVHGREADVLFAEALSEKQLDAFQANIRQTLGFGLIPVTPHAAALRRRKLDTRDLPPASFSPDCAEDTVSPSVGQDFLTWMWFFSEARGGVFRVTGHGEFAVMVEGPLVFVMEGEGAHETVLRRGCPVLSAEAKISLLSGKKLKRARIQIARGQEAWSCAFDADEFVFRGLRLPDEEALDPAGRFQERMSRLGAFKEAFLSLYDLFLRERADETAWRETLAEAHRWVQERASRR